MKRLIYYILWILSRFPVISITLDENFHNIDNNKFNYKDLRYSLFSLGIGIYKIYFLTYKNGERLRIFKVLRLNEIIKAPSENEISEKVANYSEHISSMQSDDINLEIDFLKYKISDEESTKSTATNKINNYTAIILVVLPLICAGGLRFVLNLNNIFFIVLAVIIFYSVVNIIIFILNFYKVNSFLRSKFGDLKNSSNHQTKLAESYYEDWYSIKSEAPIFVSFVTNVERYLKITIICMVLFLIVLNINSIYPKTNIPKQETNISYSINIKCTETQKIDEIDLKKLLDIQNKLLNNKVDHIIILTPVVSNVLIKNKFQFIIKLVQTYNVNNIEITEGVELNRNVLTNEDVFLKILIMEEK